MAAALQAQRLFLTASTSSSSPLTTRPPRRTTAAAPCRAGLRVPSGVQTTTASSSSIPADGGLGGIKLDWIDVTTSTSSIGSPLADRNTAVDKLRAVAEAAADRAEMHDIIGRQRDNWNHLLLHSTNSLTLAASVMAALAPAAPATVAALKASAGVLLATAAVTMAAVNRVQPSQLAEEQRNSTRLWRQLERDVHATLELRHAAELTQADVQDAMDRVLALDAAYPLPLLPGMLEKFPKAVEPARWWPRRRPHQQPKSSSTTTRSRSFGRRSVNTKTTTGNGWSQELEEEMRGLLRVLRAKDEHQYLTVGKLVLSINRGLAVAGPALAGTAAVAAAFIGTGDGASSAWASGAAAACGALAACVNTVEHGAQLGMLFELLRNCAGFYRKVQEDIEAALGEADVERRENGEVFRTKVALLLGRDAAELRQFRRMASASVKDDDIKDYAGKLF
ncbi:probable F-box protein At4g22030 [Miscanthus floridulus]|uniref:probable F-box protein At4g22030 n=1 Tax=Miscanthus floridulus TaxID=154761 RepID=UPI0034591E46